MINQAIAALPAQITQQVSQSLEGRLQAIETQVNQLNQNQQSGSLSNATLINQTPELRPEKVNQERNQPLDDYWPDTPDKKPELSQYAKDMTSEFNKKTANFNQYYASGRLTLSMRGKGFGKEYKSRTQTSAKYSQFQDDKNGIFWAIKDQVKNQYLLVINQYKLTSQEFKNTFEYSLKHINQVFDGGDKYDGDKHTGVKIIYPGILVKKGKQLELKVRGELEFYSSDEDF